METRGEFSSEFTGSVRLLSELARHIGRWLIARTAQRASRERRRSLAVVDTDLSVDDHVVDPDRMLVRHLESRAIDDCFRIEYRYIRERTGAQNPAIAQANALRGHSSHLVNRLF